MRFNQFVLVTASVLALAACGGKERPKTDLAASQVTTIGVNSYLWRASLDALSFMPLLQTDSAGGVIVTDWYVNPNSPGERMKLTVSILDQDLRADAIRVDRSVAGKGGDRVVRLTVIGVSLALIAKLTWDLVR